MKSEIIIDFLSNINWPVVFTTIVTTIILGIFGFIIKKLSKKPNLVFYSFWTQNKNVKLISTRESEGTMTQYHFAGLGGIYTTQVPFIRPGKQESFIADQGNFEIVGFTVKNKGKFLMFDQNDSAEISRTVLSLNDGQQIECRWWDKDKAELNNLFSKATPSILERRIKVIDPGDFSDVVVAYRRKGDQNYRLFSIDSDITNEIWKKRNPIIELPCFGKLKIFTKKGDIAIDIELNKDEDGNLFIIEKSKNNLMKELFQISYT